MSDALFSTTWSAALAAELASPAYRQAAAAWEGSLALIAARADSTDLAIFLDLWHGECRAARPGTPDDLATADFVLRAELETWKKVLRGELDPLLGIMSGKLKLQRGSLAKLTPHVAAARELVRAAARVPTDF